MMKDAEKVIDYVIQKYGSNQVAQIITYGTMAAKSSIRDTARVLDLPFERCRSHREAHSNMAKLKHIFEIPEQELRNRFRSDEVPKVNELNLSEGEDLEAETIKQARVLEGSLRNAGTHACGLLLHRTISPICPNCHCKGFGVVCNPI